jgi:hypothetical protein
MKNNPNRPLKTKNVEIIKYSSNSVTNNERGIRDTKKYPNNDIIIARLLTPRKRPFALESSLISFRLNILKLLERFDVVGNNEIKIKPADRRTVEIVI